MIRSMVLSVLMISNACVAEFDSSWVSEDVHDQCEFLGTRDFIMVGEEIGSEAAEYGEAIGATNGRVDGWESLSDRTVSRISYYKCPENCVKSAASSDNGLLGKEEILELMGHQNIPCNFNLNVADLLSVDFDKDGYSGYAIRYMISDGGNQGQNGWRTFDVAFIRNSNGVLSLIDIDISGIRNNVQALYFQEFSEVNGDLVIDFLVEVEDTHYEDITKTFTLSDNVLRPE